jgi:hypothetical protein
MEAWVKFNNGTITLQKIFGKSNGTNAVYQFGVNANEIAITWGDAWKYSDALSWNNNQWYHLVTTVDSGNLNFYRDGNYISTITGVGTSTTVATNLTIGKGGITGFFNGLIDEVRIYNYARTPSQIQQDYNQGLAAHFGPEGEGVPTKDCNKDPSSCIDYGLIGYWGLEEGNGTTTFDGSDYFNNGQFLTAASSPKWTAGINPLSGGVSGGESLSFDGKDDYIYIGTGLNSQITVNDAFTFSVWLKTTGTSNAGIIDNADWTADYVGTAFEMEADGDIRLDIVQAGSLLDRVTADTAVNDGNWHHIIAVHKNAMAANTKIYIDGVAQSMTVNDDDAGDIVGSTSLQIGARDGANYPFSGSIDEVRIYNRALSAEEVRYHYNKGGPVAYWKFDEGNGTTTYDESANNNDGTFLTAASSPVWVEGKYGSALQFDGVDDYVNAGSDTSLMFSSPTTMEAWVYWVSSGISSYPRILNKASDMSGTGGFNLWVNTNRTIGLQWGLGEPYPTSIATIKDNEWSFVAVTADGINVKLIIDGVVENFSYDKLPGTSTSPLYIGNASTANRPFSGFIDDVSIYNYVRTQEQVSQDYNAGLSAHFQ